MEGVAHGLRTFVPSMLAQSDPCAICTTSSAAGINTTQTGPYSISKTAVRVLTEQLYHDVAANDGDHIQVHCLFPAFVATDLTSSPAQNTLPSPRSTTARTSGMVWI